MWIRNKCYDWGFFKSQSFDLPIISIGNVAVGGAGKTPTTEYLIRLLNSQYSVAVLSRGYGRKTKGFIEAHAASNAVEIGDEPAQMKHKFPTITVAVSENRCVGISYLQKEHDVILLDDAFQHRKVTPGLSIVLFDYHQLQQRNYYLPTGNLRESIRGIQRANIVLITKCPSTLEDVAEQPISKKLHLTDKQALFFTQIVYEPLQPVFHNNHFSPTVERDTTVFLLTGIANPQPVYDEIKKQTSHVIHYNFPDHYAFKERDLRPLREQFDKVNTAKKIIVTTEKDAVRLKNHLILASLPIYYLPIRHQFIEQQFYFDQLINDYVRSHTRNNNSY